MHKRIRLLLITALLGIPGARAQAADEYAVDLIHSSMTFKVQHLGLAYVHGRFNEFSGNFTIDADPAKSSFTMNVKVETIDTANSKRDEHLRNADYFDVKQFPTITFKSKTVKPIRGGGYELAGDFTMHGVTKPITFTLIGGHKAEFPKGVHRIGFTTDLTVKRSEYGMDKSIPAVSDEVHISISFEGVRK